MNNQQTIQLPISKNRVQDFVLVPFGLFQKIQTEREELKQSLKQQKELVETLEIIREGEAEYLSGRTTTEPLSSLAS